MLSNLYEVCLLSKRTANVVTESFCYETFFLKQPSNVKNNSTFFTHHTIMYDEIM